MGEIAPSDALLFVGMPHGGLVQAGEQQQVLRSQKSRKQEVMPSSSDSEKHLAVTCDFNMSVVTGDVSLKA